MTPKKKMSSQTTIQKKKLSWKNFHPPASKINIGTLSVQELFFQLIGLLGVRLGVSPVGMVELFVYSASLTTSCLLLRLRGIF